MDRDDIAAAFIPGVREHRADDRFVGADQDARLAVPAAVLLAFTQTDPFSKTETVGQFGQLRRFHERSARLRQVAFVELRVSLHEQLADCQIEPRVPEKFKRFVVSAALFSA